MGMLKANEVTHSNVKNILPSICNGRIYIEPSEGMEFTITGAAINVFPAKGENGESMTTQAGEPIMRRVAYVLVGDEIYTSVKGWTAIEQIISLNPTELDKMDEGTYERRWGRRNSTTSPSSPSSEKTQGLRPLFSDTMTNDKIRTSFLTDEDTAKMLLDKREAYEKKHQIQISMSAFISMMIRKYEDD